MVEIMPDTNSAETQGPKGRTSAKIISLNLKLDVKAPGLAAEIARFEDQDRDLIFGESRRCLQ